MDFRIEHRFDAAPDEVAKVILDANFQRALDGIAPLSERKVLEQKTLEDERVRRRVRCVLDIDTGPARRFIGDGDPAWIEDATWDPQTNRWEWEIEPLAAPELLEASGTMELEGRGDGTVRTVSGRVRVKIPLLGGKVEGWICDGLRRAYDEEAQMLRKHLSG